MRKELVLALLPLVLVIGLSLGQQQTCPQDNFASVNVTYDDVRRTSSFGLDLFRVIKNSFRGENIFYSPYSIWSTFVLALLGAEGDTLLQLSDVLNINGKPEAFKTKRLLSFQLSNGNGVSLQEATRAYFDSSLRLEPCFQSNQFFDVRVSDLSNPASTAAEVNNFVSRATNGLITRLLSPGNLKRTNFILVNAIYFKGTWQKEFQRSLTRKKDFCSSARVCQQVDMMSRPATDVPYVNNTQLGAEVIDLPYSNSSISMLLFLPWNVNTVDGVVDRLNLRSLAATLSNMKPVNLRVELPKFKMEQTLQDELKKSLGTMGITDLFRLDLADLSSFTKTKKVSASDVIHRAVIDVNEEGTEAAAATALFDTRIGGIPPPPLISFNRPFVFMIVDKKLGLTIFNGIYRTPPA